MNNQDRPGEHIAGRSYRHRVKVWHMAGWSTQPRPQEFEFTIIGHYKGAKDKDEHFVVEYVETGGLPYMVGDDFVLLLTILRRELTKIVGIEVTALRRDLILQVGTSA